MRRFNRGYALAFLITLLAALMAIRTLHQWVETPLQEEFSALAAYTLDDWLDALKLEELLGEPPVTPFPADQLPITPTPGATPGAATGGGG